MLCLSQCIVGPSTSRGAKWPMCLDWHWNWKQLLLKISTCITLDTRGTVYWRAISIAVIPPRYWRAANVNLRILQTMLSSSCVPSPTVKTLSRRLPSHSGTSKTNSELVTRRRLTFHASFLKLRYVHLRDSCKLPPSESYPTLCWYMPQHTWSTSGSTTGLGGRMVFWSVKCQPDLISLSYWQMRNWHHPAPPLTDGTISCTTACIQASSSVLCCGNICLSASCM